MPPGLGHGQDAGGRGGPGGGQVGGQMGGGNRGAGFQSGQGQYGQPQQIPMTAGGGYGGGRHDNRYSNMDESWG
uniref:Uncharacterized protein n=1 Tax=Chromera velia CCMP2878 TaxID=1169474 RepID=A0A0G4HBV0_9ALVE|eukprot:Cvel_26070.t1-p1 / transcript=Cvel_26070.t1 / gene=Cvel_26070 / organism=Chromera_velia_CCMP2878 / gene_product=hypothetical protein / transcript_product=hypothetical protein / location=Cvel_scaffold3042:20622-20840(-) / protein_length=73 / sequence_SO=supercontig / SO=protein_coding / is_pseudo=false